MKYEKPKVEVLDDTAIKANDIIQKGCYDAAVALMDDDIREEIHRDLAPCTDLDFLVEYMKRHKEKYGIDFVI